MILILFIFGLLLVPSSLWCTDLLDCTPWFPLSTFSPGIWSCSENTGHRDPDWSIKTVSFPVLKRKSVYLTQEMSSFSCWSRSNMLWEPGMQEGKKACVLLAGGLTLPHVPYQFKLCLCYERYGSCQLTMNLKRGLVWDLFHCIALSSRILKFHVAFLFVFFPLALLLREVSQYCGYLLLLLCCKRLSSGMILGEGVVFHWWFASNWGEQTEFME